MHQINIYKKKNRTHSQNQLSRQLSMKATLANQQKIQQTNLFDKLLLPPLRKSASEQKARKHEQKFQKPDIEAVMKQNINLKKQINKISKNFAQLKVKIRELEMKNHEMKGNLMKGSQKCICDAQENMSVYPMILKKKVEEMNQKMKQKDEQIQKLKKLPNSKIFDENNIQKKLLILQTIRLTAKISTLQQSTKLNPDCQERGEKLDNQRQDLKKGQKQNNKFQSHFIKILKQQNQKLKGGIRLLENDKTMMKASQQIQLKEYEMVNKKYKEICKKFDEKERQIQMLRQQNKNLVFKKAQQFNFQCQQKQRLTIQNLTKQIQEIRAQKKKVEQENDLLLQDNKLLKDKEKLKSLEMVDIQQKYQSLKLEMAETDNRQGDQYKVDQAIMINDKKSYKDTQSMRNHHHRQGKIGLGDMKKNVKFSDITLGLLVITSLKKDKQLLRYQEIFDLAVQKKAGQNIKEIMVTFRQLQLILSSQPLKIPIQASLRLSSYIFQDHLEMVDQVPYIRLSNALTILKATLNQFSQLLSASEVIKKWQTFLNKRKKLINDLQNSEEQFLTSDKFLQMVLNCRTSELTQGQVLYMQLMGFCRQQSVNDIILSRQKLIACMKNIINRPIRISNSAVQQSSMNVRQNSLLTSVDNLERINSKSSFGNKQKPKIQNRHRLSLNWIPKVDKDGKFKRFSQIYQLNQKNGFPLNFNKEAIESIRQNSLKEEGSSSSISSPSQHPNSQQSDNH